MQWTNFMSNSWLSGQESRTSVKNVLCGPSEWIDWIGLQVDFGEIEDKKYRKSFVVKTYVDEFSNVTLAQIVQNRCVIEVCQVGHVLSLLVFRRVKLLQEVLLDCTLFSIDCNFINSLERKRFSNFWSTKATTRKQIRSNKRTRKEKKSISIIINLHRSTRMCNVLSGCVTLRRHSGR